ncbi:Membrane-bound lytic murein transglycosylase D [hydrothermal vent metagenome]|uniref:Membrane-bound lytic murein transglycosylase D n=1 Tax=hydrothermal vent metagenome TaxID=652676 RepID=A0A3B0YA26_9ZZZZ
MLMRFRLLLPATALLLGACASQPLVTQRDSLLPGPSAHTKPEQISAPTMLASAQPLAGILSDTPLAPEPVGLWESMRRNFGLPSRNDKRVQAQRNWYARHPEYMRRVSQRASRYAAHILQQVEQRGMPAEIALLPVVESAYDPFAYSHGRAAGLWQFIPGTGKRFGLKQDWWYDGRRDLLESTRAALDYLEYLHKRFDDDWLLALAAYNSGEGTVGKAIRRNRKKGKPTSFWDLDLPKETRAYVPKLIALKQLVNSPEKYDVVLTPIDRQVPFEVIETGGQIDLAIAAELAGMELDSLYRFNSGFNQWATPPKGPHRLLIPKAQAESFRAAIAALPPEKRIQWVRHKVAKGQTLGHIARRYHTTVDALKAANQIRGHAIRAGKHLLVPVSSTGQEKYRLSASQRLNRKQNASRKGQRGQHIVTRGDTFWDLSQTYKVSVRKLASWNGMAPGDPLRVGQKLVLWTNQPSRNSSHPGAQRRAVNYTVRRGDSLARISSRFKVRITDLRRWNGLPKKGYLQPGQRLKLFVDVTRQTGT